MWIEALDPKATHINNPDCPSRLVPLPFGDGWVCLDCGFQIVRQRVEMVPKLEATDVLEAFAAQARTEEDQEFTDTISKVVREGEPGDSFMEMIEDAFLTKPEAEPK